MTLSPTPIIHEHRFRAMGSQFYLWLEHDDAGAAEAVLKAAASSMRILPTRLRIPCH
jgi:hypothetical protein